MQNNVLNVSGNFRKVAIRSIYSILLFILTYIILIALGIGVVLLCGLAAYSVLMFHPSFVTGMIALGFLGMGLLIFFFLIKFIFSGSKKVDRSHLVEITKGQQPGLFNLISEIVTEVNTDFPKKVYISADVNASVFYDSNFWSMFFPVRKNLQIGLGLMNAISATELKAILAHEFGHFSQRSMKVGSYVHHVNKVIYNMLYENEGYNSILGGWSNISAYFALFAKGSVWVIQGIQYVLTKVHTVLNLNYMALSREMEFHADAVAASVAGSQPLVNSLLRLGVADLSLNLVFNYYDNKIQHAQKPLNLYPQHYYLLNKMAMLEELPVQDDVPILSVDSYRKFNKTKLVLDDQWSSHPSTEQRVEKLKALNEPIKSAYSGIAIDLLVDKENLQELITDRLFLHVKYEVAPTTVGLKEFIDDHIKDEEDNSYPAIFKSYYDDRDPYSNYTEKDFEPPVLDQRLIFEELINKETLVDINSLNTARADRDTLEHIHNGVIQIETFDYDGIKYNAIDAYQLVTFLEAEITRYTDILNKKDYDLFTYFLNKAAQQDKLNDFKTHSLTYQASAKNIQGQKDVYTNLVEATIFMQNTTPFDEIIQNMVQVKKMEKLFKEQIKFLMEDALYEGHIDNEILAIFEEYLSKDWKYFGNDLYFNQEVDLLFSTMFHFSVVVFKLHFKLKKSLLEFQVSMLDNSKSLVY